MATQAREAGASQPAWRRRRVGDGPGVGEVGADVGRVRRRHAGGRAAPGAQAKVGSSAKARAIRVMTWAWLTGRSGRSVPSP